MGALLSEEGQISSSAYFSTRAEMVVITRMRESIRELLPFCVLSVPMYRSVLARHLVNAKAGRRDLSECCYEREYR